MTEQEALAHEFEYGQAVFATDDAKEGPKAFAEKRTPNFQRKSPSIEVASLDRTIRRSGDATWSSATGQTWVMSAPAAS